MYFAIVMGNLVVGNSIVIGDPEKDAMGGVGVFETLEEADAFIKQGYAKYISCLAPYLFDIDEDAEDQHLNLPNGLALRGVYLDYEPKSSDLGEIMADAELVGGIVEFRAPWTMWT